MEYEIWRAEIPNLDKYKQGVLFYERFLAEHIRIKHSGSLASTCHRCLSTLQTIRSNRWMVIDIEKVIALDKEEPKI